MARKKADHYIDEHEADTSTYDDDPGALVAPEHKAMETKGIRLAGKVTLDQYEELVRWGYDGDVVRRWTQHHADQVLRSGSLHHAGLNARWLEQRRTEEKRRLQAIREAHPRCPQCGVNVNSKRMAKHLKKIHGVGETHVL